MLSFPGAGRGPEQQSSPHSCFLLFQLFFCFFNFLSFFLNYLAVATCSCFLLGFFSFFISTYWKKYMYVISTPILLLPFAGCQSVSSQNHSQNVNTAATYWKKRQVALVIINRHSINHRKIIGGPRPRPPPPPRSLHLSSVCYYA